MADWTNHKKFSVGGMRNEWVIGEGEWQENDPEDLARDRFWRILCAEPNISNILLKPQGTTQTL